MFISRLRGRLAAAALAAVTASALVVSVAPEPAAAEPTHHRPGVEGLANLFDWSEAGSSAVTSDTWWVYARAGEVIHATTEDTWRSQAQGPDPSKSALPAVPQVRVRLLDPDGAVVGSCVAEGIGKACAASATATDAAVYRAVWDSPNLVPNGAQIYHRKDVWVTAGATDKVGRVFTTRFNAVQHAYWQTLHPSEFGADGLVASVVFYVVGDDGTLFKVDMKDYNGVSSAFQADSVGIFDAETCAPTDRSGSSYGSVRSPRYLHWVDEGSRCDRPFLVFPDLPSADLPAALTAAEGWDGPIYPRYELPETPAISAVEPISPPDPARPYAAAVTLDLGAFKGVYEVGVDVNADGDLADAGDVVERLDKLTPSPEPVSWRWDGRDAKGQPVADTGEPPLLTVRLVRANRYSLLLSDVEVLAGGARVEQLAGYLVSRNDGDPVRPKIHWDDSDISEHAPAGKNAAATLTTSPKLVTTPAEGLSQDGYVHGWTQPDPADKTSSWGDAAVISFNVWNDVASDGALAATVPLTERRLVIESKTGALSAPQDGARRISYLVTARNTGEAPFTGSSPAVIVDTLPLHVADWRVDGVSVQPGGEVNLPFAAATISGGKLTWSGPLAAGAVVMIRYSGLVEPGFAPIRVNTVTVGQCAISEPFEGAYVFSSCDPTPKRAEVKLPGLRVDKSVDRTAVHRQGEVANYTVTLTNVGQAAYTAEDPARVTDDLSAVLDDAALDVASIRPVGAKWDPDSQTISWSGPLAVGARQEITYGVAYAPGSDLILDNTASIHDEDVIDVTPGTKARVTTPGSDLHISKAADAASVEFGGTVGYTITLDNSRGQTAAPVAWVDDLSGVLDEAELAGEPKVDGAGVSLTRRDPGFALSGSVAAGSKVTVTYAVKVDALPPAGAQGRGDGVLRNTLRGECEGGDC
ncbi:MAG: DUF11 domain-containing protein, partial [Bifidobacteriaceae bacterium]|nr:DUF11 domain-containing protein [Bifidobacteriaceae bacterium]